MLSPYIGIWIALSALKIDQLWTIARSLELEPEMVPGSAQSLAMQLVMLQAQQGHLGIDRLVEITMFHTQVVIGRHEAITSAEEAERIISEGEAKAVATKEARNLVKPLIDILTVDQLRIVAMLCGVSSDVSFDKPLYEVRMQMVSALGFGGAIIHHTFPEAVLKALPRLAITVGRLYSFERHRALIPQE